MKLLQRIGEIASAFEAACRAHERLSATAHNQIVEAQRRAKEAEEAADLELTELRTAMAELQSQLALAKEGMKTMKEGLRVVQGAGT